MKRGMVLLLFLVLSFDDLQDFFLKSIKNDGYTPIFFPNRSGFNYRLFSFDELKNVTSSWRTKIDLVNMKFTTNLPGVGYDCDDYSNFKMGAMRRLLPSSTVVQVYDYYHGHAYCFVIDSNKNLYKWDSTSNFFGKVGEENHAITFIFIN